MNIIFFIYFIYSFFFIYNKNIILPFKRVLLEAFSGNKTINDYINYDLYTDLYMGTPPQKVTHFIEPDENIFQFKRQGFQYNKNKFNSSFIFKI